MPELYIFSVQLWITHESRSLHTFHQQKKVSCVNNYNYYKLQFIPYFSLLRNPLSWNYLVKVLLPTHLCTENNFFSSDDRPDNGDQTEQYSKIFGTFNIFLWNTHILSIFSSIYECTGLTNWIIIFNKCLIERVCFNIHWTLNVLFSS